MGEHEIKRKIRDKLKLEAKEIARRIGYANYNVDGAEEDFRSYLKEYRGGKMYALSMLPDFKNHIEYINTVQNFIKTLNDFGGGFTGTCNPYSPIIIASSEMANELSNIWDTYFKLLYDYFWLDIMEAWDDSDEICLENVIKIKKKIYWQLKQYWSGANEKGITPYHSVFYTSLRCLMHKDLEFVYNFAIYLTFYHTFRQGAHQWQKLDKIKQILINDYKKAYQTEVFNFNENEENDKSKKEDKKKDKFDLNKKIDTKTWDDYLTCYIPFEERFFLTECNLIPNPTMNDTLLENRFLFHLIDNFKVPRIVILNPDSDKWNENKMKIKDHILKKSRIWHFRPLIGRNECNIEVYRYQGKFTEHILIRTRNLSNGGSNLTIFNIANKIKEFGEMIYG